jgi:hypothetical protein
VKAPTLLGAILIVIGLAALAYQGFTYTTREKIVDIGPLEATKETKKTVPVPPVAGALSLIGGIVLVAAGSRR